jgi:hypothetical protein
MTFVLMLLIELHSGSGVWRTSAAETFQGLSSVHEEGDRESMQTAIGLSLFVCPSSEKDKTWYIHSVSPSVTRLSSVYSCAS